MPRVLITGGSDGIGRALVEEYSRAGWEVWATGRRAATEINPPLPASCHYMQADLTKDVEPLLSQLPNRLDLAILNAGAGRVAPPEQHAQAEIASMIALNTRAPLLLAQGLFESLQGGTLAFIGSTASKGAHRDFSVYAATKAALAGAHRALTLEWEGRVNVLLIDPGPTATGMHDKAGLPQIAARRFFTPPRIVAAAIAESIAQGKSTRLGMGFTLRHMFAGGRS